jgi:hypothetical protein
MRVEWAEERKPTLADAGKRDFVSGAEQMTG